VLADWMEERFGAEVTWLPFDLHPEYPRDGLPRASLLRRYGEGMTERMSERFAADGLVYAPNPDVVPNTRTALRVTELARDRGLHRPFHDRLMDAYWAEGANIGDPAVLRALAAESGLDAAEVDETIAGDAYLDRVLGSTAQAQSLGITGIPAFLLDRRLLVLGAQPREVFERAFARIDADGSGSDPG
jgi:predicted DsbA family dithiol-disulfide isomerase